MCRLSFNRHRAIKKFRFLNQNISKNFVSDSERKTCSTLLVSSPLERIKLKLRLKIKVRVCAPVHFISSLSVNGRRNYTSLRMLQIDIKFDIHVQSLNRCIYIFVLILSREKQNDYKYYKYCKRINWFITIIFINHNDRSVIN